MQVEEIKHFIETGLDAEVVIEGDGTHFTALVISKNFIGKSRIQRQQMVYDTVKQQLLDGTLHALSIKTLTPDEWATLEKSEDLGT